MHEFCRCADLGISPDRPGPVIKVEFRQNVGQVDIGLPIGIHRSHIAPVGLIGGRFTDTGLGEAVGDGFAVGNNVRNDVLAEVAAGTVCSGVALEFFNEELAAHLAMLDDVTALLLGELKKGKSIEIAIKGFASPLAQSDYNKLLTERRISSVINYFSAFQNGALLPYLNNRSGDTKLIIKKIPYGEEKSEKMVSDNPQDRQNSVFSISAARERRVEILRISEVEGG